MSDPNATLPAAATTPQQQTQGTPTQQTAPTPISAGSGDQLVCQWQSCGERLPSAELLYVSRYSSRTLTSLPAASYAYPALLIRTRAVRPTQQRIDSVAGPRM